jgi:hypothetical protein
MTYEEMVDALLNAGWRVYHIRAHCTEYRASDGRWVELWDNGDAAYGMGEVRSFVGTYEAVCTRFVDAGAVRRSLKRRVDDALAEGMRDQREVERLLWAFRKTLQ